MHAEGEIHSRNLDCLKGAIVRPCNRAQTHAKQLLGLRARVNERLVMERRHEEGGCPDHVGELTIAFKSNRMFDALAMVGVHIDVLIEARIKG